MPLTRDACRVFLDLGLLLKVISDGELAHRLLNDGVDDDEASPLMLKLVAGEFVAAVPKLAFRDNDGGAFPFARSCANEDAP